MKEGRVHATPLVVLHTIEPLLSSSQLPPLSRKSQGKMENVKKQPSPSPHSFLPNTRGKFFFYSSCGLHFWFGTISTLLPNFSPHPNKGNEILSSPFPSPPFFSSYFTWTKHNLRATICMKIGMKAINEEANHLTLYTTRNTT